MKKFRFLAIVVSVFVLFSLFGCGDIDLGKMGLSLDGLPFADMIAGGKHSYNQPDAGVAIESIETAVIEATEEIGVADAIEETEPEVYIPVPEIIPDYLVTRPVIMEETAAVCETDAPYRPVQTEAQTFFDGSCNHKHNQEAEAIYGIYGDWNEYLQNKDYLSNHRLVIARGGLRLRDKPNTQTGKQVALIPDGEIITTMEYRDGWAYAYYDGKYGWCSTEFLFDPFIGSQTGGVPMDYATVISKNGVELFTDRICHDDDSITTIIPYETQVTMYYISGGMAYVAYRNIYGYCSVDALSYYW